MSANVNIEGINKMDLLKALWDNSDPARFYDSFKMIPPPFGHDIAKDAIKEYIDHFSGRMIKCDLSGNIAMTYAYDRDYGKGKFQAIVDTLKRTDKHATDVIGDSTGFQKFKLGDDESGFALNKNFLTKAEADTLLAWALGTLQFKDTTMTVYGRKCTPERKTISFGDKVYKYSGTTSIPETWPVELLGIRKRLSELHPQKKDPTFVLANLYKKGTAVLGWHSDNEPGIVAGEPIYSLTVGAECDFMIRGRKDKNVGYTKDNIQKITVPLPHGSLCVMTGKFQSRYQHQVPARKRCTAPRVNFTFRYMK
jgi:alkylated DNA repair dioxygenase AlkB